MRELDRWAITEKKIAADELMERAGEGLAAVVARRAPAGRIAIVCGKGNNGGDGIVAARLLRQAGRDVEVHARVAGRSGSARTRRRSSSSCPGRQPIAFEAGRLNKAHVIVDALLGTGSSGSPREPADAGDRGDGGRARAGGRRRRPVGRRRHAPARSPGPAVHCVATAAFHRPKVGLWVRPGKEYAGEVEVVDIGIPRGGPARPEAGLIGSGVLREVPRRSRGVDEVLLRQRLHHRRLARADGRAEHGRAGRDARRGGLRDGRRAGKSRAELHGEAAGGDDGRAARGRRRAPRRERRGAGAEGGRPRGRGRARPGAVEGPGRAGAGAQRSCRGSTCRW